MNDYNKSKILELRALRALGILPFDLDSATFDNDIADFQRVHGLTPDGKAGPSTWAKLREARTPAGWLRRLPRGLAEINAVYGDPGTSTLAASTVRKVKVHKKILAEFDKALAYAMQASGYVPASVQTYNLRKKRGGDGPKDQWSTHSWGIAFDVDPERNPWGNKPNSPVIANPAFAATFRALGWSCGCDWKTPDTMHFQACTGY